MAAPHAFGINPKTLNMILKMKTIRLILALGLPVLALAQEQPQAKKPQFEMGLEGMIGVSYGSKTLGINVGGPSLKLRLSPDWKLGVGAFPSLIILDRKAYPKLAVSPILEYHKWMVITPYYGYDAQDNMIWTFGLGYRFR